MYLERLKEIKNAVTSDLVLTSEDKIQMKMLSEQPLIPVKEEQKGYDQN